jgi:ubiquitin related modifier 1
LKKKSFAAALVLSGRGGLELLFGSKKKHQVDVSPSNGHIELTVEALLVWIRDNLLKERPEMFMKDKSVRPGVLVLINDSDWELCGRLEGVLEDKDTVTFISTLHGG